MSSLAELKAIGERVCGERADTRVLVGMATCGIAAGAAPVLTAFEEEVAKLGLSNVDVSQTGCIGICQYEPVVEIVQSGR